MDNINESHSKLSYDELVKQNSQLTNKVNEIERESKRFESRFKNVIGNSQAGYFFIDNDGLFQEVNDAWLKLYKYDDSKEVIGNHFAKVQQIDDLESAKVFIDGIRNQDPNFTIGEFSRKCKDGSIGYHSFSAKPVFDKNKIIGIEGFLIDITKRKNAEVILADSEAKYRALYENAPLSYQSLDLDGHFIDINPAWLSTLGYKREEVIGKSYSDFLHPDWKSHFETNFPEFKRRGYVSDVQFKIRHKKGHYIDISFEGCIGTHPDGSFKQTYCVFKDITENKRIEEALNKNQYYLSKAQEMGKIGSWELDIINNKLIWTKENYKNFGVKYGTPLTYEIFSNCIHPDDRDYVNSEWNAAIEGKPYDIEHRIVEGDKVKWLREKANLKFDENGKAISAIGFTQDITSFKESESRLKESETILKNSEERFELAMNAAQDGLYDWDLLTNEIYYSPSWKKMLGYEDHELPNDFSIWEKLTKPEDTEKSWQMQQEVINKKRDRFELEFKMKHKNGNWVDVLSRADAVFNNEGKAIRIVGTHVDITEKIKSKEKIARSESIQRKMISNIGDVVVIIDKNGINRYKSPNVKTHFGWEVDELVGKGALDKIHQEDLSKAQDLLFSLSSEPNKTIITELRYLCKSGEYRWIQMTISNLLDDPDINGFLGNYHDITKRKKYQNDIIDAKRLAEESEAVLKTTLQTAMDGYWVIDMNGYFLNVNNSYCKMSGYNKKDLLAMRISDVEAKQSSDEIVKTIQKIKQLGQYRFESKHIRKDGTLFDVEVAVQYQYNQNEQIVCFLKDITEQKKHEQELIKAKEKINNSLQQIKIIHANTPNIIWKWDIDKDENFKNSYISEGVDEFLVLPKGSIDNSMSKFFSYILPEYLPTMYELIEDCIKNINKPISFEFEVKRADGQVAWFSATGKVLREGNKLTIYGSTIDVTKNKQTELELVKAKEKAEENELRFKTLHNASFGGIAIHENGIILDCNYGLSEISGFSQKELMGMDGLLLINEDTRDIVVQNIATEYYEPYEVIGVRKNGEEYPLRLGAKEIPYKSKKVRVVEFRDITFQKKIEKQLISAKEKAEESDKLKSAFLSNMSHEIRTPMNGILGFTELLQDTNLSVENQKSYIGIIRKSSDRLLNSVNDIIEISKIESGEINTTSSEVDLIMHLDTLVTFFKPEAEKKGLKIVVHNNIGSNDLSIKTDKNKLGSILSNLIKNAIKYSNEGTIKVGFKIENRQILFSCQDSGIGIPKNRLEAIFNRFEQADIDDKQAHQGSGLGLAIVKSYAEMLDGKIWVESEEGKGSSFYVSLPYNPVKKEEKDLQLKAKISDSGIKKLNVLIVEDDEYSLMHLEAIMNGITKNIRTAQNGIEAVLACKNDSSIDLVLMDMRMPRMDGIEATRQIRKFNKDVIIVAQTAFAFEEDKRKALKAGCTDYISKPIEKNKLVELIDKYF